MPVHDWTRVDAGVFHDFHSSWIIHLKEALNAGLLPGDYYAQAEQHAGDFTPDVLTAYRKLKRTLTIRHVWGNKAFARFEIAAPASQDGTLSAEQFAAITSCLADNPPDFYIEPFSVGDELTEMPLFLNPDYYVNVPLEKTYLQAWHGMPAVHRQVLELP